MTVTARLKADGTPDHRYAYPSGMRVQGVRVDYMTPQPVCGVCAHFDRIHRQPFVHRYHGAWHCAERMAA